MFDKLTQKVSDALRFVAGKSTISIKAWVQSFSDGAQGDYQDKVDSYLVRAVRAF